MTDPALQMREIHATPENSTAPRSRKLWPRDSCLGRRARGAFRRCAHSGGLPRIESFVGGQPHIEVSPRNRPSEHSGENHPDLADDLTKIQSSRIRVPEPLARMERLADTCLIS